MSLAKSRINRAQHLEMSVITLFFNPNFLLCIPNNLNEFDKTILLEITTLLTLHFPIIENKSVSKLVQILTLLSTEKWQILPLHVSVETWQTLVHHHSDQHLTTVWCLNAQRQPEILESSDFSPGTCSDYNHTPG